MPSMASAAARAERPLSNSTTWAPMKRRNCSASVASSTDLPEPVGPTISVWPTSSTNRSRRNGVEPRVCVSISGGARRCAVGLGPGPHRRHRHQMDEVEGVDDGLAHIGIEVAGQAAEPGLDRVQALADGGDAAAVDDALQAEQLLLGPGGIRIGDDDGRGQIAEGDIVGRRAPPARCRHRPPCCRRRDRPAPSRG